jgi:CRP-like cAMP-binding protein
MPKNKLIPAPPEGEPSLYVVKRGHVQLTYTDEMGNEAVVILLGPGDVFGSMDPSDLSFGEHCRTVSEACVCRISRQRFEVMLQKYPGLAFSLTKFSLLRINRLQVRLAEMMMRQADERLALALLDLDKQVGRTEGDGRRKLSLALTHADLAKLIGTSREMVTMILGKFRKLGLVETNRGWIYLTDLDGLRRVATRS